MTEFMKVSDIQIPYSFKNSRPSAWKMDKYRDYWATDHKQLKPIMVNQSGWLKDGYIQYLVLRENGVEIAEIERKIPAPRKDPYYWHHRTTYIYAKHPDSSIVYMWRVRNGWEDFDKNVRPGDAIYVSTKFGVKEVEVVDVKTLDECPVFWRVRKVASKKIMRGDVQICGE